MQGGQRSWRAAVVGAALCLLAPGTSPAAAAGSVTITVEAGFEGLTRPGRLTPVRIFIEASGSPATGSIDIDAGPVRISRDVVLGAPARKRLETYIRIPSADVDRLRVEYEGDDRSSVTEVPLRFAPEDEPFVLCVRSGAPDSQDHPCTATVEAAELPESWRGYDAVDEVSSALDPSRLTGAQRTALSRWSFLRTHETTIGPPLPTIVPERQILLPVIIAGYVLAFMVLAASPRALNRFPLARLAAISALVTAGCIAVVAHGRIGPEALIVVRNTATLRSAVDFDETFVSTRGVATFPTFERFSLRSVSRDAALAFDGALPVTHEDADGVIGRQGVFGKGQRIGFEVEGFLPVPLIRAQRSGDDLRVENVGTVALEACRMPAGISPAYVPLMRPAETVRVSGRPTGVDSALTCVRREPPPVLRSDGVRIENTGVAAVIYDLAGDTDRQ